MIQCCNSPRELSSWHWGIAHLSVCCLQALADDMLRKLAPKYGVQLPTALMQGGEDSSSAANNAAGTPVAAAV